MSYFSHTFSSCSWIVNHGATEFKQTELIFEIIEGCEKITIRIKMRENSRNLRRQTNMIQWYPGHMHKAKKELLKILPQADLVIEVLDARIPYSSQNPLLAKLRKHKPCIKLLNKSDLADLAVLSDWRERLEIDNSVKTLSWNHQEAAMNKLPGLCRTMIPTRPNRSPMIYALIVGIPNVGKSTLINKIAGRVIAKTGNEAALTRMQQRIELSSELTLIDTPGMLWPKIENENSGYRLAATGAIRDTAIDLQDVAWFIADYLKQHYAERLMERFAIERMPDTVTCLIEAMAKKRGCIKSGGIVDFEKISRLLIVELRNGELGGLCLETPSMIELELAELEIKKQQEAEMKASRQVTRKK
jgi:ribosome biogenesis GTPase A